MSYDVCQLKNKPTTHKNHDRRIIYINTCTLNNYIHNPNFFFIIFKFMRWFCLISQDVKLKCLIYFTNRSVT